MDLMHGQALVGRVSVQAGDYPDLAGCRVVVICAGVNQKPGENRLDLLNRNAEVFRESVLPVSVDPAGVYGISDLCLSVPCVVGRDGVEAPVPPQLSGTEAQGLSASAEVLRASLSGMTIGGWDGGVPEVSK